VELGGADDVELEVGDQLVVVLEELQVGLDALADGGVGESFDHAPALVVDTAAEVGEATTTSSR